VACAQTGTGKTVSFLVPILNSVAKNQNTDNKIKAVIIAPTRELALQIDKQIDALAYFVNATSIAIYGGGDAKGFGQEKRAIVQGADIIVGTPGKLITHLNLGYLDLSAVEYFVLDEADRMLDMGFREDIYKIYNQVSEKAQSLLFTATMPNRLQSFVDKVAKGATEVKVAVSKTAKGVKQRVILAHDSQKLPILEGIVNQGDYTSVLVFTGSKKLADEVGRKLKKSKLKTEIFHSNLDQVEREEIMIKFRSGKVQMIVATDVLSRGIDIDNIELVVNYDVPKDPEDYVHRVGRTARANKTGTAITFINSKDVFGFSRIEKLIELKIEKENPPKELGEGPSYTPNSKSVKKRTNTPNKKKNYRSKNLNSNNN
jgi:superfamily II DNA/RNA helicase